MGACIALGIEHQANRQILQDWLETWWRTRLMADEDIDQKYFNPDTDMYIVDYQGIQHFSKKLLARRYQAEPIFLPIFYLGKLQELQSLPTAVSDIVDDFITLPVQREEFTRRLRTLLRTRELSIENDQNRRISEQLRGAMDSSDDAIFLLDNDNTIRYSNQASKYLLNGQAGNSSADTLNTLFEKRNDISNLIEAVKKGVPYRGEVQLKLPNNQDSVALLRISYLEQNDHFKGTVLVITDITEQKRIQAAEREQRVFAQVLRDIAVTIVSTLELQEVFDRLLNQLSRVIAYDYANIALLHNDQITVERRSGYSEEELTEAPIAGKNSIDNTDLMKQLYAKKRPLVIDSIEDRPIRSRFKPSIKAKAYVGVPIMIRNEVIGFLNVFSKISAHYTSEDADRMVALADLVAIAIENARLYDHEQEVARQEARRHLARDLHDSVTQTLFSATVIAEAIPRLWHSDTATAESLILELHQLTRGALAQTRTLLLELRPDSINHYSIYELLHQLAQSILSRKQVEVHTNIQPIEMLGAEHQRNMYYIAHEALNNVIKHSKAKTVEITLKQEGKIVILSINDDGIGFDIAAAKDVGMGLQIMQERAQEANINLKVTSEKNKGSKVQIEADISV